MGRPGRGSGGGSRGGGSFRMSKGGGSSRPGRGTSRGPSKSMGGGPRHHGGPMHHGPMHNGPRHHHGPMHHHHHRRYVSRPRSIVSELISTVAVIIIFVIFLAFTQCDNHFARKDREPAYNNAYENSYNDNSSQKKRKKIETSTDYIDNCIMDETGWFEQKETTCAKLKNFWNKTGVQPYIILKKYDSTLTTDEQKEKWTEDYYNQNIETENVFLIVHFEENDAETVGLTCYYHGASAGTVMDEEAISVFQNNLSTYWFEDLSTDDVFIKAFNDTANDIM